MWCKAVYRVNRALFQWARIATDSFTPLERARDVANVAHRERLDGRPWRAGGTTLIVVLDSMSLIFGARVDGVVVPFDVNRLYPKTPLS